MRRVFAELSIDEERLIDNDDEKFDARLEEEFGWLEQSGVFFKQLLIGDEEDEEDWARYVNYLFEWAVEHSNVEEASMHPQTYKQWKAKH